ncbi:MAG: hypothetical protein GY750_16925 [Lentisphaerae bacterium]|nr:hypothetical protein [Lentisphaerota bacterium]
MEIGAFDNIKEAHKKAKVKLGVVMTKKIWTAFRQLALEKDISASQYLENLAIKELKKNDKFPND